MDEAQPVFHENFNFHDGNLLVSASGSRDGRLSSPVETVHFRLHKSILAIYSTTFADMLSMPQGNSAVDHPVVHLQDPLDHVIKLFTAIYYGGSVPQGPLSRAKWDFVVPVFVLADKYDMERLATNLLPKLLEDWPTTLKKWDDADTRTSSIVNATANQRLQNPSLPSPDDILPEPAMVIKFGQAHPAARSILPAAFYHLSRLSHSAPEDLSVFSYQGPEVFRSANHSLLTSEDWVRIARGQANIREWLYDRAVQTYRLDWPPPCPRRKYGGRGHMYDEDDDIGTPNPCEGASWWDTCVKPYILEIGTKRAVDALVGIKDIQEAVRKLDRNAAPEDELRVCNDCQDRFIEDLDDSRRKFWAKLPSFFGLGDYPNWGNS